MGTSISSAHKITASIRWADMEVPSESFLSIEPSDNGYRFFMEAIHRMKERLQEVILVPET